MVHTLYWNFHICYLLFSLGTWMLGPWIKRNWKWSTEDGKSKDQHFRNQWANVVSKSLIWFSVDGRGCVPSRLLSLRRKTSRTLKKKQIWGILTLKRQRNQIDLIFLLSKGLSSVFSNTTVQKHQLFSTQPFQLSSSHICTWLLEKHSSDYIGLCWQSDVSAL